MKEFKVIVPEGYEIDKENSSFECIKFKPKTRKVAWAKDPDATISGYAIDTASSRLRTIPTIFSARDNWCVFPLKSDAESALASARILQIMDHDPRFGGRITTKEWNNPNISKYVVYNADNKIDWTLSFYSISPMLLAFHTEEQLKLFIEENRELVKMFLKISDYD